MNENKRQINLSIDSSPFLVRGTSQSCSVNTILPHPFPHWTSPLCIPYCSINAIHLHSFSLLGSLLWHPITAALMQFILTLPPAWHPIPAVPMPWILSHSHDWGKPPVPSCYWSTIANDCHSSHCLATSMGIPVLQHQCNSSSPIPLHSKPSASSHSCSINAIRLQPSHCLTTPVTSHFCNPNAMHSHTFQLLGNSSMATHYCSTKAIHLQPFPLHGKLSALSHCCSGYATHVHPLPLN